MTQATTVGLCIALVGPLVPVAHILGDSASLTNRVLEQLFLWLLFISLVVVVVAWEKRSLSSVGLIAPTGRSFGWGAAAAAVLLYVVSPLSGRVVEALAPGAYEAGLAKLHALPMWFLVFAGATAGVVEELFYRGYAVERLSTLTGNGWAGALLALLVFVVGRIPFWSVGAALGTLPAGALLTALYVWKRDLTANMFAHASTAIVQLLGVASSQELA